MALPANVDTGQVTGRFIVGVVDGPDPDSEPDAIAAQGTISFTASVPYLPNPTASPAPVTILKTTIIGVLDDEGYLCTPDPADPLKAGTRGLRLIATDDPDLSVQTWTWNVIYNFVAVNGVRANIQAHSMALPSASTVDLTTVMKVPSSTGIGIEQAEALAASASLAAQEASAAAVAASDAAQATDTGVATLVAQGGATTQALDTPYRRDYSVKEFGAVGDGTTDSTAAIQAAVNSGVPLYWGDTNDTYRVTAEIAINPTTPVSWTGNGATILCDAPSPIKNALTFNMDGQPLTIAGPLTIDAAQNAFTCLYAVNSGAAADVRLTDLTVENAYRSSRIHNGGDGIHLRGAYRSIIMDRPTARNIRIAAGAEIQGSQGITGITVSALDSGHLPGEVLITSPHVENILSDDAASSWDQDAIRIMTATLEPGVTAPYETSFNIVGGTIRNTGGRAIKSQAEWGNVHGLKVIRDVERARPNREIDFQKGGGTVSDVAVQYASTGAQMVVCFGDGSSPQRSTAHGTVNGLTVIAADDVVIEEAITIREMNLAGMRLNIRNVEVIGGALAHVLRVDAAAGAVMDATISDVFAAPHASALLAYYGEASPWTGQIIMSNFVNTGATDVPVMTRSVGGGAAPTLHTSAMIGYTPSA